MLSTFVLVLTLIGSTNNSGQAIESIPGFSSMAGCLAAGNFWVAQVQAADYGRVARALCIEQK